MEKIRVWTKQHKIVWEILERDGIYHAHRRPIKALAETDFIGPVYDWLANNSPTSKEKPEGADYPIWLSFSREGTMLPTPDTVLLELEIDPGIITNINIAKWGHMLNYGYIPKDEKDKKRHYELLEQWGTSDAKAGTTPFYPEIKREIMDSWKRLFDDSIQLGGPQTYGNIWEVRKEWVQNITIL